MTRLADRNDYLSAGVHIGMKENNKHMKDYVFKKRSDGIAVLDIEKTDDRIALAAKFLSSFKPEKVLVVSRRSTGQKMIQKFAEAIGAKQVIGRFMPGALTNPSFKNYFEADIIVVIDPTADKQAMREAIQRKIPIIGICNTNNDLSFVDLVIPANNKGNKSVGLVLYLVAKEIMKSRNDQKELDIKDFQEE